MSLGGSTIGEMVGPLVAGGLELDVSGETRQKVTSDALQSLSPIGRQLLLERTDDLRRRCKVQIEGRAYRSSIRFKVCGVSREQRELLEQLS